MGQYPVSTLLEGQVAPANVQPLSTTDVVRKRTSRGGVVLGLALKHLSATPCQSPALDRPSSLLGKVASAQGPDTARNDLQTVKYLASGRNIGQHEGTLPQVKATRDELRLSGPSRLLPIKFRLGRYCDQRFRRCEPILLTTNENPVTLPSCSERERRVMLSQNINQVLLRYVRIPLGCDDDEDNPIKTVLWGTVLSGEENPR